MSVKDFFREKFNRNKGRTALSFLALKQKQLHVEHTNLAIDSSMMSPNHNISHPQQETRQSEEPVNMNIYNNKVWIKDGVVQFGTIHDTYPVIVPTRQVTVFLNGVQLIEPSIIKPTDTIYFDLEENYTPTKWKMTISSDRLQVSLRVKPGTVRKRVLKDHKPTTRLELQSTEREMVQNTLTAEAIYEELINLKVVEGISHSEIQRAIDATEESTFIIATGTNPEHGKDGSVKFYKNMHEESKPLEKRDGSLDFKEIHSFPTVSSGEVFADIIPPTTGIPGKNVLGETIPHKNGKEVQLKLGCNVQIADSKIVALENGCPKIEARGRFVKIEIRPKFVLQNDVNIETGNIRFNGSVEVQGSVEDAMVVEANGDVLIHGYVSKAQIKTSESVVVKKNAIASVIWAGEENILLLGMQNRLSTINRNLELVYAAMQQLVNQPEFIKYHSNNIVSILHLLVDRKFAKLPATIKSFYQRVIKYEELLDPSWNELATKLYQLFTLRITSEINMTELQGLLEKTTISEEWLTMVPEPKNIIQVPYAINSELYCDGDVEITDSGCYNTKIIAGSQVTINGFARNGDIYAKDKITVQEVGTEYGITTSLRVSATGSIEIGYAYEGTRVQIGTKSYTFKQSVTNVRVRLNENNMLVF